MSRQSRFDARYWMLGAGALGRPRGMVWGGRREEGSEWGTHVYLWRIHFNTWQNQYNIVKFKNKIKFKKKKKRKGVHRQQTDRGPWPVRKQTAQQEVSGEWEKLYLCLQLLPNTCITAWAPPPVRPVAALDSHGSSNPTLSCVRDLGFKLLMRIILKLCPLPQSMEKNLSRKTGPWSQKCSGLLISNKHV